MRKTSLIAAILLLSAVWAVAQTSPSSSPQSTTPDASSQQQPTSPSSTSPSQQPAAPDTSSTTTQTTTTQTTQTSSDSGNSIEGCLNGSAGNWTLTDQSGKTYQLSGDTSKLSDHVGHQVRIMGTDNSSSASERKRGQFTQLQRHRSRLLFRISTDVYSTESKNDFQQLLQPASKRAQQLATPAPRRGGFLLLNEETKDSRADGHRARQCIFGCAIQSCRPQSR